MMQRRSIALNRPDLENQTIYWAVQTIDTGLAKSEWSEEQVYLVGGEQVCVEDWSYGSWSGCSGGTQTRSATDLNSCGTTDNRSALSRECEEDEGGGGGSSGAAVPPDPNTYTKRWTLIQAGKSAGFAVGRENISVTGITVQVRERVTGASVSVARLGSNPVSKEPVGTAYQFMEISQEGLDSLEEARVNFTVNSSWITDNDVNASRVFLNRYVNGSWVRLDTRLLESSDSYHVYDAVVPGFSYFSISGDANLPVICEPGERRCSLSRLEECGSAGTAWNLLQTCLYGCSGGACVEAVCELGQVMCSGNSVLLCNVTEWVLGESCAFGCVDGQCNGFPVEYVGCAIGVLVVAGGIGYFFRKKGIA